MLAAQAAVTPSLKASFRPRISPHERQHQLPFREIAKRDCEKEFWPFLGPAIPVTVLVGLTSVRVFRFCDFLARYFTKFSSLNTFSPEKRHISASSEGRIGPNSRVGPPPASSRLRGPPRNRKSSEKVFLRGCYTIPSNYYYYYCLIAPPLDLTYLILSRT